MTTNLTHGLGLVEVCQVHLVGINADCSRRVVDRRMVESSSDNVANSDLSVLYTTFRVGHNNLLCLSAAMIDSVRLKVFSEPSF